VRPDFLFIGPDKTGSSWLHSVLRQHPQCQVPTCKDLYFYDRYYHRGYSWYERQFGPLRPGVRALGELSHDYLFSVQACERIAKDLPGVRLLCCLRDPCERSFSHYLYLRRNGRTKLPFQRAIEACPELVEHSLYGKHLARYFALFPREQIKILFFENLQADAAAFAREILSFLGLEDWPGIDYRRVVRSAARARSPVLASLVSKAAWMARNLGLPGLVGVLKHSALVRLFYRPYSAVERPRLEKDLRLRLIDLYSDDIQRLQLLLNRDLSGWLTAN
jgi:hypothetical protein